MPDKLPQQYVCVELTEECNNACRHCYNYWRQNGRITVDRKRKILSATEVSRLVRRVKADTTLKYVALSGGEPLLREDLPEIVASITNMGLQPVIITNGVLLTESLLKRLPSGVNFEITLMGDTASLHNALAGRNVFDTVVHNMANIEKHGSYLTLMFVATKLNALAVYRTVELGVALGAVAVMYNRVNLGHGTREYAAELVPPAEMLSQSLGLLQKALRKYPLPSVCSVPIPPCVVDTSAYPDIQFGWCPQGSGNAYYTISCDGFLRPCNHSSRILGDLRKAGFADIVSSEKCKSFWREVPAECNNCNHVLKDRCLGGCRAASEEFYGSQDQMDPFCEFSKRG